MKSVLATVAHHMTTGLPEDDMVNSFVFSLPDTILSSSAEQDELIGALNEFYNDAAAGMTRSLSAWMGPAVSRVDAADVKLYDLTGHLDGSPHGSPFREGNLSTADAAFSDLTLPQEVAVCLTIRGSGWATAAVERPDGVDPGSEVDRPRQRKTGRLYLGCLGDDILAPGGRPGATYLTDLRLAGQELQEEIQFDFATGNWVVWSRVDAALYTVTHVQTDDAFDTQRRRGVAPTARTTLAVP